MSQSAGTGHHAYGGARFGEMMAQLQVRVRPAPVLSLKVALREASEAWAEAEKALKKVLVGKFVNVRKAQARFWADRAHVLAQPGGNVRESERLCRMYKV